MRDDSNAMNKKFDTTIMEKWVLRTGSRTQGRYWYWQLIAFFICMVVAGITSWITQNTILAFLSAFSFFLTIVVLERRYFYQIVKRQEDAIKELQRQLRGQ